MNSSKYKKSQLKYLCKTVGSNPIELEYIINHKDEYYNEWFEKKLNKVTGEVKKYKDGTEKQRAIRPSLKRLKIIQSAIKNKILAPFTLPINIQGGIKKRNNITNAKPHQGKKYIFTTDLKDFYPNVDNNQVYHAYLLIGCSHYLSNLLTKLTTWKYELPQGTPTSTHIANLVFFETDEKLISISKKYSLTYTRYVDDLTFSSQQDFQPILNNILNIIKNGGFNISYRKTQYKGNQTITGINVFNNFIDAPEKIKEKATLEQTTNSENKPYSIYLNTIRRTNKNMQNSNATNSN